VPDRSSAAPARVPPMTFADPWVLLLLLPVLGLLPVMLRTEKTVPGVRFPDGRLLRDLPESFRARAARILPIARGAALTFLVVALARPQVVEKETQVRSEGIDIMLAVDVSTSMMARDLDAGPGGEDRLQIAKKVLREFIRQRQGDRLGTVVFAARPYLLSPLTLDHDWLLENLARVETGMIEDGTALGDGLLTALTRLTAKGKNSDGRGKIVILLTDGRNNAGAVSPTVAAASARALGIRVYTIGVGSRGRAVYPMTDPFGSIVYRQVEVDIDEPALQEIARTTGAGYFRATDAAGLLRIYQQINALEKRPVESREHVTRRELFLLFLLPALMLLLMEIVLNSTLLRRAP
jgi:Ca-activated chloride channel homolog